MMDNDDANADAEQYGRLPNHRDTTIVDKSFTWRAVGIGLCVGAVINLSNTYYGLRVGGASQMSMVSAVLGFGALRLLSRNEVGHVAAQENVLIISVATATGCMPVTAGFIGIIPALEYLIGPEDRGPLTIPTGNLILWSTGLCCFGIIFAAMLRDQFIVREKLPWPGANATAQLVNTLHENRTGVTLPHSGDETSHSDASATQGALRDDTAGDEHVVLLPKNNQNLNGRMRLLGHATALSGIWTIFTYFLPILHELPVFGPHIAREWLWTVDLSPGFFGQGIIMGPVIPLHMLFGAIVGWGFLSPYAKSKGWVSGDTGDWATGARGWITWVSLAALFADASVNLVWLLCRPLLKQIDLHHIARKLQCLVSWIISQEEERTGSRSSVGYRPLSPEAEDVQYRDVSGMQSSERNVFQRTGTSTPGWLLQIRVLLSGFCIATIACTAAIHYIFGNFIRWYFTLLAIGLSLPMAVVGIRALAETDYNPESALVSQLSLAALVGSSNPNAIIINLVAAGITQAGSNQAGLIAYDLKVGELVGARPEPQVVGQLIGSVGGALISCLIYRLYASQYPIPGPLFKVPASFLVLNMAKLVTGKGLPEGVAPFVCAAAILSSLATVLKIRYRSRWWQAYVPSGTGFAIGIYNMPSFTIVRAVGGITSWAVTRRYGVDRGAAVVFASGLLLGESLASLVSLALAAMHAPKLEI